MRNFSGSHPEVLPCSGCSVWMPVLESRDWMGDLSKAVSHNNTMSHFVSAASAWSQVSSEWRQQKSLCCTKVCWNPVVNGIWYACFSSAADWYDRYLFFFHSLISGKKNPKPTPLISVDSPLHRNSRRDNQGLCDIIAALKGRVFIAKCYAYQPLTVINTLAIKRRKKANRWSICLIWLTPLCKNFSSFRAFARVPGHVHGVTALVQGSSVPKYTASKTIRSA